MGDLSHSFDPGLIATNSDAASDAGSKAVVAGSDASDAASAAAQALSIIAAQSSGWEKFAGLTDTQVLAALSGDAGAAFDWGGQNLTNIGTIAAATGSIIGNLTLADDSITSAGGAISFGNENLSTTGTFNSSQIYVDTKIIFDTSGNFLYFCEANFTDGIYMRATLKPANKYDIIPYTNLGSDLGDSTHRWGKIYAQDIILTSGSITDTSGVISFGNENLSTTGTLNVATNLLSVGEVASRVGIRTATPQSILHIHGTQSYGALRLTPTNANGESSMAFFLDTAGTDTNDAWVIGASGWGNTSDFVIGNENNGAGGNVRLLIEKNGNVGVGVTAFGTNAKRVLGINADGVAPTSSPAGMIQIFADDSSGGATNATLGIRTEEGVATEVLACDSTLNIWINGTEYHLLLRAV